MSFVRYGSRFLTKKRSTVGYLALYGSRLKTETENGVFLQRYGKRFGGFDRHAQRKLILYMFMNSPWKVLNVE